ncbi:MAG: hypothetical protein LBE67_03535 [Kocuria palustris]|nr:hypothetical protein [Kocuria palustris]
MRRASDRGPSSSVRGTAALSGTTLGREGVVVPRGYGGDHEHRRLRPVVAHGFPF